jgi:hypothetical protein
MSETLAIQQNRSSLIHIFRGQQIRFESRVSLFSICGFQCVKPLRQTVGMRSQGIGVGHGTLRPFGPRRPICTW